MQQNFEFRSFGFCKVVE